MFIAKYEFQTGTGLTAFDTSGVDPAADLTISGSVAGPAAGHHRGRGRKGSSIDLLEAGKSKI